MTKFYNKDIPVYMNVMYSGRQSCKTYYEFKKLKEENKKLKKIINEFEKYLIDVKQFAYLDKLKELEKNTK